MRIPTVLAIGLTLTAIAVGVSLTRSPLVLAGTDGTLLPTEIGATRTPDTICQAEEMLPRDTTVIRVSLLSLLGPRIKTEARAGGRILTSGEIGYGWTGDVVAIPVKRVSRAASHVTVCFKLARRQQLVNLRGANTKRSPTVINGSEVLPGRMRIEYLRPGGRSWLSLALPTARRIGLNVGGGAGIVVVPFLLILSATALTSWLLLRDLR